MGNNRFKTLEELDKYLRSIKPYTNDELLILFSLFIGKSIEDMSGKSYKMEIGIFQFDKNELDRVTINPKMPSYTPPECDPFKDALSNEIFRGICSQFRQIPLLINQGGFTMNTMIKWRLKIGR